MHQDLWWKGSPSNLDGCLVIGAADLRVLMKICFTSESSEGIAFDNSGMGGSEADVGAELLLT